MSFINHVLVDSGALFFGQAVQAPSRALCGANFLDFSDGITPILAFASTAAHVYTLGVKTVTSKVIAQTLYYDFTRALINEGAITQPKQSQKKT
jgi:hypothetical protein